MSWAYLYVFFQSNLLEVPFYHRLVNASETGSRPRQIGWTAVLVTLVNSLTHPLVFFGFMNLRLTYLESILLAEAFAIVGETVIFQWLLQRGWGRSVASSVTANFMSWQVAPMLTYLAFG